MEKLDDELNIVGSDELESEEEENKLFDPYEAEKGSLTAGKELESTFAALKEGQNLGKLRENIEQQKYTKEIIAGDFSNIDKIKTLNEQVLEALIYAGANLGEFQKIQEKLQVSISINDSESVSILKKALEQHKDKGFILEHGELKLSSITELTPEQAVKLSRVFYLDALYLDGLKNISPEVAEILSWCSADVLYLSGITKAEAGNNIIDTLQSENSSMRIYFKDTEVIPKNEMSFA